MSLLTASLSISPAQWDEAKVRPYKLPELLTTRDGLRVETKEQWEKVRRPELLGLFEEHVFGCTPPPETWGRMEFETIETKENALDGLATRKRVRAWLPDHPAWPGMEMLIYIPTKRSGPVPFFVGLNFWGNHGVTKEKDIPISTRWFRTSPARGIPEHSATERTRGTDSDRWAITRILEAGFGLVTCYYGDIEPDAPEGWKDGIRGALAPDGKETLWGESDWATIGAWAWGLSRMADYVSKMPEAGPMVAFGHSRLGKTALWATAQDPRFAAVISNNSGKGGASLMRRNFGETTAHLTTAFPHWFARKYASYVGNESACPIDKHMLLALAAPRPLYVASATEDQWSDPKGEYLAAWHTRPVYQLYGLEGLDSDQQPGVEEPVGHTVRYHLRKGKHGVTNYDWEQYIAFAKAVEAGRTKNRGD